MRRLVLTLSLSLFVHLLLWTAIGLLQIPHSPTSPGISVEILESKKKVPQSETAHLIVRDALLPDQLKAQSSDDPARFLSAQSQRVKQETRAALSGMTQNRSQKQKTTSQPLDDQGLRQFLGPSPSHRFGAWQDRGASTVGEILPQDVRVGSFTALNTDRHLFYSFYSRIEELIRYRWESAVQRVIDSTAKERLAANVKSKWVTHIEILLDSKGEFKKALIMKESGLAEFDNSAAQAFAQARLFPNPPKEMVQDDGLIHLSYSFTVQLDPRLLARP